MNWALGLMGLLMIFMVWEISDLLYKQHFKSLSTKEINIINGTRCRGSVIDNNVTEAGTKICFNENNSVIKDNYIVTP